MKRGRFAKLFRAAGPRPIFTRPAGLAGIVPLIYGGQPRPWRDELLAAGLLLARLNTPSTEQPGRLVRLVARQADRQDGHWRSGSPPGAPVATRPSDDAIAEAEPWAEPSCNSVQLEINYNAKKRNASLQNFTWY